LQVSVPDSSSRYNNAYPAAQGYSAIAALDVPAARAAAIAKTLNLVGIIISLSQKERQSALALVNDVNAIAFRASRSLTCANTMLMAATQLCSQRGKPPL
jgi:hypothetical protein